MNKRQAKKKHKKELQVIFEKTKIDGDKIILYNLFENGKVNRNGRKYSIEALKKAVVEMCNQKGIGIEFEKSDNENTINATMFVPIDMIYDELINPEVTTEIVEVNLI